MENMMKKIKFVPLALVLVGLFCIALMPTGVLAQEVMTNQSVIDLVKSGVSEKDIIAKIKSSKSSKFDLSPAAKAQLEKAGVTKTVILAIDQSGTGGTTPIVINPPIDIRRSGTGVCEGCVRYRVIATGFVVNNGTTEGVILRDGRGDEVFVAANVAELSSANAIVGEPTVKKSVNYGDTDGRADPVQVIGIGLEHYPRYWTIQAGSGGANGGLLTGDRYPAAGQSPRDPSDATIATRGRFLPMILWEGDLRVGTNPNAVLILPTIWESDDIDAMWTVWNTQANSFFRQFARSSSRYISGTTRRPVIEQVDTVLSTIPQRNDYDRPIGIDGDAFNPLSADPGPATFIPAAMLLKGDNAEEAVAHGVYEITYRDGTRFGPGSYTLSVRVERVP